LLEGTNGVERVVVWHVLGDAVVVEASNVGVVDEHRSKGRKAALIPADAKGGVLPVVELYGQVAVEESITVGVAVLKLILSDSEVDVGLSEVRVITTAGREESSISVGLYPERYGRGVMKNKSLNGQVLHLSVEPQSSVVGGIWVILLALLALSSSPEIDLPVSVVCAAFL